MATLSAKQQAAKQAKQAADKRKAEKEAADLPVTSAEEWLAQAPSIGHAKKLRLPSGNVCLAINPGMQAFLEEGLIPNSLIPIVMDAVSEGKGIQDKKVKEIAADPDALKQMLQMADRVVCYCVQQPHVEMPPVWTAEDAAEGKCTADQVGSKSLDKREPGVLYIDVVDMEDKNFIYQWAVGGTADLQTFRKQQTALVEDVGGGEDVPGPAERSGRSRVKAV